MVTTRSGSGTGASKSTSGAEYVKDKPQELEFGGPIGVTALMIWSHYILLYFWYCWESNSGEMVIPTSVDSLVVHLNNFGTVFMAKGIPSSTTWIAYLMFFVVQLVLAAIMPGLTMEGLPTAPHGHRLKYHCNGYLCYYFCMGAFFVVGLYTDIFPLTYIADHFGEALIASMIIADSTSVFWYLYGLLFADEYNGKSAWIGNIFYDFFMGTILYPRIGEIDIKMIAEVRWSWITLMMITCSCAAKQYESLGYISPNMWFMIVAHWMYSNACVKGEHCIPPTWDMFHENYGWMLNFWNICGVPFLYCYQSIYILRNQENISAFYPTWLIVANFVLLFTAYYIFDSANAQKASIKIRVKRHTFPQVPWGWLEEPIRFIKTPKGNLLVDGWYAFVRKIQYTGDILMALSWGLATGLPFMTSPLNFFYCTFFTSMIIHRQSRDEARCSAKYGKHWDEYVKQVPNVFLPGMNFYVWLFTGKHPSEDFQDSTSASPTPSARTGAGAGAGSGSESSPTPRKRSAAKKQ